MLKCNGKTFMNLQEAVQWLLNNNALFFMCNEDYAADTEISLSELVNPSPANPIIGSLVLFADGSIAAITGITDDSFTVGSDAINIRLEKTVTHFTIDASQHLIVHYSDGTSDDLGAIFSGDVNIAGTLTANAAKIFEEITDKDGHKRFIEGNLTIETIAGVTQTYGKWSLSGSHLMLVIAGSIDNGTVLASIILCKAVLPEWIVQKIVPIASNIIANITFDVYAADSTKQTLKTSLLKIADEIRIYTSMTATANRYFRIQYDLLIDNE